MDTGASQIDWNSHNDFFKFTRGRFIVEEAENARKREIRFDMNSLARVAAQSGGAARCIAIEKYPDGMFNKAFLITMDNGQEAIAKIPNPNAGIPHSTTASEVATMDFARKFLETPAPPKSHPVGAEFIIMEKIEGVPLSQLQVLLAMTPVRNSGFAIGPATGRDWCDAGRSDLDVDKGPWASLTQYLQAVGTREVKAIQSLEPPKTVALFCGPKLYRPDTENKLTALAWYQQTVDALIPKDAAITRPCLWHNDLHDDNVFVDPQNPGEITGIIDWQSCHISPLFNHNPDPAFLDWDGLEPETLDLAPRPGLSGLSPEERSAAVQEYSLQNVFIAWRKLMHAKNPDLYRVVEFRRTATYGLIFLAHRIFEYSEAHFQSLLIERIKLDSDGAVAGTELVTEVKEKMGDLWPDKGFIEHERYNDCKADLDEVKGLILEQLAETDEEKAEYERYWPFG
ncbi:aminoglycoside phosphotransferase family protein [Aspergillus brunneoviolaceus CBS 621.78]|uniref:Phosphotransferase enzyme family protein n=1 Tax=Aspergillus brunneoviolaceus CBS 621.78 TaxID=1450534 RepID=A0ACD1G8Q3_9EURO|nr:phosphotransferase enzyme family protein [Aspergillus brunneoviolaceus CBS 621.78]RAH45623.1 phosphotransferase enzyme family protein [Aspergillus brunneoviolaceus CBS 621.78]